MGAHEVRHTWYSDVAPKPDSVPATKVVERLTLEDVPPVLYAALEQIVATQRKKAADYAKVADPFSNFGLTAQFFGMTNYEAADFNEVQKLARLAALRLNKRDTPENEAVEDTYLDKAVYAVLAFAMYLDRESHATPD